VCVCVCVCVCVLYNVILRLFILIVSKSFLFFSQRQPKNTIKVSF